MIDFTKVDLHTHTVASGHAYNTLREMAKMAADKKMDCLGITEHAPNMPGTCPLFYFHNLKVLPRNLYGVELLLGTEANIIDYEGSLDLRDGELRRLDVVIASLHVPCLAPGTKEENTNAYLKVLEHPYVDIIGHPDDSRFPVDYEALVRKTKKENKILEINNSSLSPLSTRVGAGDNDRVILSLCKEYEVPIVLSSDAHFDEHIGVFDNIYPLLEEMNFPDELVLNGDLKKLKSYLHHK